MQFLQLLFRTQKQMIETNGTYHPTSNIMDNHSFHLPKTDEAKKLLKEEINSCINQLKGKEEDKYKIQILELRKTLIDSYGLSVERIDNLENIFLYYCTHIFKTGKHMTFERLQYEKSHMTMDRFFVFLKDFGLTSAVIDGITRQILDKNQIILLFKKVSINCKDLNFEQFISLLEKIALLFYDSKTNYNVKMHQMAIQRKKRKENYLKSMKKRKAMLQAQNAGNGALELDNEDKKTDKEDNNSDKEQQKHSKIAEIAEKVKDVMSQPQQINQNTKQVNQNDNFIDELMNDKNIVNPNELIKTENMEFNQNNVGQNKISELELMQNIEGTQSIINQTIFSKLQKQQLLLILTPEEKIQYFYQLINVDNSVSFKKKMRELNLPLFQSKHKRITSQMTKKTQNTEIEAHCRELRSQTILQSDEQKRLQELKIILEQRKDRDKASSPHMSKDLYQARRRKRLRDQQTVTKKQHKVKKIDLTDLQTDLSSLSKIPFQNINFHKFNPQNMYELEQNDPYLQQYFTVKPSYPHRSQKRVLSSLQTNDKHSQIMLQRLKKRAQQIQIRQKNQQSKYTVNSDSHISTDHQIRKNKLVQKLLKIHKN